MQLWRRLYSSVWTAFFACVLIPRWMGLRTGLPVHALLGLLMLVATLANARQLLHPVPERLRRIIRVTSVFLAFQAVSGLVLGAAFFVRTPSAALSVVHAAHGVCALAILAQASSVATAYDMWRKRNSRWHPDAGAQGRPRNTLLWKAC